MQKGTYDLKYQTLKHHFHVCLFLGDSSKMWRYSLKKPPKIGGVPSKKGTHSEKGKNKWAPPTERQTPPKKNNNLLAPKKGGQAPFPRPPPIFGRELLAPKKAAFWATIILSPKMDSEPPTMKSKGGMPPPSERLARVKGR